MLSRPFRRLTPVPRHPRSRRDRRASNRASCKPREWTALGVPFLWRSNVEPELLHVQCPLALLYAIAFALRRSRKIIRGLKEGLTEEERYAVADHAVAQLKERGDPWRLNEEAPTAEPPST